jgi:hypothetical protein
MAVRWRCPLCGVDLVAVSCEAMLTVIYYHLLSEHSWMIGLVEGTEDRYERA